MRGLHKLHGAAQTMGAREDYQKLVAIAQRANRVELIPSLRESAGWRAIDAAARVGVESLLRERPGLRAELKALYPGFVE